MSTYVSSSIWALKFIDELKELYLIFKVIELRVENNQKDAVTLDSNSFILIDDQNREFSGSSESLMALGVDKTFILKELNPGLSATGLIAFDVPKDPKGFYLHIQNLYVLG
ncbi:DUF4352 domain-containing protein [Paenibacillus alba]|uniref:DUF4352 domain-containing protein n=1 Tax=Paenibacillus alba TaxID=1197127 RepID=A0ABU6G7I9_9BACL|nr:DUF4352 domain-containing protein [Paenibacillus alba]MEC0228714.1 DUF4352 domain-containing protein [Paenibacillus alba]